MFRLQRFVPVVAAIVCILFVCAFLIEASDGSDAFVEHRITKREDNDAKLKKSSVTKKPTLLEKSDAKHKVIAFSKPSVGDDVSHNSSSNVAVTQSSASSSTTTAITTAAAVTSPTTKGSSDQSVQDEDGFNSTQYTNFTTKSDTHIYYNSTFYSDPADALKYWVDFTSLPNHKYVTHEMLSNSHRRAITVHLNFTFPFYGHLLSNVTIATGGFLYLGDTVHSSLAATQYVAPLMANFDTSLSKDSVVQYMDNGTAFVVQWNNVIHRDQKHNGSFSFQASLYDNGDIVFVYKDIPFPVTEMSDAKHPVKVGISDAYVVESQLLKFIRRKTIYEYHRIDFKKGTILNGTAIYFTPIATCLSFTSCNSCLSESITFNCNWCEAVKRCSNSVDRYRQHWVTNKCEEQKSNAKCPSNSTSITSAAEPTNATNGSSSGTTQKLNVVIPGEHQKHDKHTMNDPSFYNTEIHNERVASGGEHAGFVSVIVVIALLLGVGIWVYYAYRNPQTSSGQFLIKYRPSEWRWRGSEARYTAASIHM